MFLHSINSLKKARLIQKYQLQERSVCARCFLHRPLSSILVGVDDIEGIKKAIFKNAIETSKLVGTFTTYLTSMDPSFSFSKLGHIASPQARIRKKGTRKSVAPKRISEVVSKGIY